MTSLDQLLADADFPTQDLSICLKGSLVAEWEEADGNLQRAIAEREAAKAQNLPMGATTRARDEADEKLEAVRQRMEDASVKFRLTALPTSAYQELAAKYPPRVDEKTGMPNMADVRLGFNTATFFPVLVRASIIVPNMTDDQWSRVLDRLTHRQFDMLAGTAYSLNKETDGQIPFSFAASSLIQSSGETSSQPESSESPLDVSGASGGPAKKAPKAARKQSGMSSPAT